MRAVERWLQEARFSRWPLWARFPVVAVGDQHFLHPGYHRISCCCRSTWRQWHSVRPHVHLVSWLARAWAMSLTNRVWTYWAGLRIKSFLWKSRAFWQLTSFLLETLSSDGGAQLCSVRWLMEPLRSCAATPTACACWCVSLRQKDKQVVKVVRVQRTWDHADRFPCNWASGVFVLMIFNQSGASESISSTINGWKPPS